jgi:hypothetical protein
MRPFKQKTERNGSPSPFIRGIERMFAWRKHKVFCSSPHGDLPAAFVNDPFVYISNRTKQVAVSASWWPHVAIQQLTSTPGYTRTSSRKQTATRSSTVSSFKSARLDHSTLKVTAYPKTSCIHLIELGSTFFIFQ